MNNIIKIGARISLAAFAVGIALLIAVNKNNEFEAEVEHNDIETDDKQAEIGKLWEESFKAYGDLSNSKKGDVDSVTNSVIEGLDRIVNDGGKISVGLEGFSGTYATPLNSDYLNVIDVDYTETPKEINMTNLEKVLWGTSSGKIILLKDTIISEDALNPLNYDKERIEEVWNVVNFKDEISKRNEDLKNFAIIAVVTGIFLVGTMLVVNKIKERKRKMKEVQVS